MDDGQLVTLYLRRDETAIEKTAEQYGRRLYALSLGITADAQTAEECENDTYLQAWHSIPPHEPRGYLYAFLARITRHISLNRCRDRARLCRRAQLETLSAELEQCIPAPDDTVCRLEERALQAALNGFLGTLSREKRGVFLRRYWFLDPVADIAARYGMSESKVKSMLLRLRRQLRAYLIKEGYEL